MMQNITQALHEAAQCFVNVTTTPRLDAEILLAHVLSVQRSYLYTYPDYSLSMTEQNNFAALVKKRVAGWPIAYLTGHREFWSLDLAVTPDTLIPRPETELLVELILKKLPDVPLLVADLGTGSGAIALALAHERPRWTIYATDISSEALAVAKANAARLKIKNIIFPIGAWCSALPKLCFDIMVSNPPYIAENDPHLQQGALPFEPSIALVSGEDGLKDIQDIIYGARHYLKVGGSLFVEHGFTQAEPVCSKFLNAGYTHILSYKDFSGLNRVTTGIF
ncbi:MAG: HemK family modification methylase [Gammaproteobacteria bacterium]|jgi:release factor glutamine methyltransferase|nr:HemK family modification methylase [Gammaproteobacteria bacterium]